MNTIAQPIYPSVIDSLISNLTKENQFLVRNFIMPGVDIPDHEMAIRYRIAELLLMGCHQMAFELVRHYELILESALAIGRYSEEWQTGLWTEFFADIEALSEIEQLKEKERCRALLTTASESSQNPPEDAVVWLLRYAIGDMRQSHRYLTKADYIAQFEREEEAAASGDSADK